MALFSKKNDQVRCGVLLDINSGSVGVAIVISDKVTGKLETVWTHRENALIKAVSDERELLRSVHTCTINALLELGGTGLKALASYSRSMKITSVHVVFSAPWSYVAIKNIAYNAESAIEITEKLIDELIAASTDDTAEATILEERGLTMVNEHLMQVMLNDYMIPDPIGKEASTINLSLIRTAVQSKILQTVTASCEKMIRSAQILPLSFMDIFYRSMRVQKPMTTDCCLVDISLEATEIAVVRDDLLRSSSHITTGLYELARKIVESCKLPTEEAFALLREGEQNHIETYSEEIQNTLARIFAEYEVAIQGLFTHSGDALMIPQTVFMRSAVPLCSELKSVIQKALQSATGSEASILVVTPQVFEDIDSQDTALAVSAHYFHTHKG